MQENLQDNWQLISEIVVNLKQARKKFINMTGALLPEFIRAMNLIHELENELKKLLKYRQRLLVKKNSSHLS